MRHKKLLIGLLAIALLVGSASAGLISYFGQVKMTATVTQSVLLDGKPYMEMPIEDTATATGGQTVCRYHWLKNEGGVPVAVHFATTYTPALTDNEITVTYLKSAGYEETVTTVATQGISIDVTVEDIGSWIQWTFNYFAHHESGNVENKLAAAVVISYDGEEPAFQVHNNDGVTPGYDVGTWLYCPYIDGWWTVGDHDSNTPVANIGWIDAATDFGSGTIVVKISEAKLVEGACETFYWAVYAGIRSGGDLPYTLSLYPEGFNWVNPFALATILELIGLPFTLDSGERLDFYICYSFNPLIAPGTYTIYTTVEPAP